MKEADLLRRITAIDLLAAELTEKAKWELTSIQLPFYVSHRLVCLHVWLAHGFLDFDYLDDSALIQRLTGNFAQIQDVNKQENLRLETEAVPAYVKFVMAACHASKLVLVESEDDVFWQPLSESDAEWQEARAKARSLIHPLRVSPVGDVLEVGASAYQRGMLVEVDMRVTADGNLRLGRRQVLMSDLPGAADPRPLRRVFDENRAVPEARHDDQATGDVN